MFSIQVSKILQLVHGQCNAFNHMIVANYIMQLASYMYCLHASQIYTSAAPPYCVNMTVNICGYGTLMDNYATMHEMQHSMTVDLCLLIEYQLALWSSPNKFSIYVVV